MKRLALFLLALTAACSAQLQMDRINTRGITVRNSSGTTVTTLDQTGINTYTPTAAGSYTFGGPAIDTNAWNLSTLRLGVTDATLNFNRFAATMQFQLNPSATNAANIEKGPVFFRCVDNDTTATVPPACVGGDSLGQIVSGNMNGSIWGWVSRFQVDSGGDGAAITHEFDSTNFGTSSNHHQDDGGAIAPKTTLWLASFGSQPTSWMFDSVVHNGSQPGWLNGISLRNINAGGIGIDLPNNIGLYWRNAANTADLKVLNVDASNNAVINVPSGSSIFFQVNGTGLGFVSGSGWNLNGAVTANGGITAGGATIFKTGTASNTDITGELTFSAAATASYSWANSYATHPECTLTPQFDQSTNRMWVTYTGVASFTINFSGAVTGTVGYTCTGRS